MQISWQPPPTLTLPRQGGGDLLVLLQLALPVEKHFSQRIFLIRCAHPGHGRLVRVKNENDRYDSRIILKIRPSWSSGRSRSVSSSSTMPSGYPDEVLDPEGGAEVGKSAGELIQ